MAEKYQFPRNVVAMVGQAEELFQRLTQLPIVREHLEREGKQIGGYVTIARADGAPLMTFGLGHLYLEKVHVCHRLSLEKALRLADHIPLDRHRLSRQSANKAEDKYPGAVYGKQYIISFSGLPADLDEFFSAAFLCRIRDAERNEMYELLTANDNDWIAKLNFMGIAAA